MKFVYGFFVVLIIMFCSLVVFGDKDTTSILEKIEANLKGVKNFHIVFHQILKNPVLDEEEVKKGEIFFQKNPLRVRWEISYPDREILLINEKWALDYFPDEKLAYKYSLNKVLSSKILIRFLKGDLPLKEFEVKKVASKNKIYPIKLEMVPKKPDPSLVMLYVWTDYTFMIRKLEFIDFFNNKNSITFKKISVNLSLSEKLFELSDSKVKIMNSD